MVMDCKGGPDARAKAARTRRLLHAAGARSVAVWPDEATLSLWALPPRDLAVGAAGVPALAVGYLSASAASPLECRTGGPDAPDLAGLTACPQRGEVGTRCTNTRSSPATDAS